MRVAASPYGRTSGAPKGVSTAGYTREQILDSLESGSIRPVPASYQIEFLSPVLLRTEAHNPLWLPAIPAAPVLLPHEEPEPEPDVEPDAPDWPQARRSTLPAALTRTAAHDVRSAHGVGLTRRELEAVEGELIDMLDVDEEQKDNLLDATQARVEEFKRFLYEEVAPLSFGAGIAMDEFNQEIKMIFGDDSVNSDFRMLSAMLDDALTLKSFEFLSQQLQLSPETSRQLLSLYMARKAAQSRGNPNSANMLKDMLHALKDA